MSVTKHTYPSGKTAWSVRWKDAKGKRRSKFFPCNQYTKKQAMQAEAKYRNQKFKEEILGVKEPPKVLFEVLSEKFLEYSEAVKKKNTHRSHENSMIKLSKFFNGRYVKDINLAMVEDYKIERLKEVKPASVNRELSCLKYMLKLAEEWGQAGASALTVASKIKMLKEPPGRIRYLSKEEIKRFLQNCLNENLNIYFYIGLNTGMRDGEIVALKWKHIDLENDLIHVEEQQTRFGTDTLKNHLRRDVPINKVLKEILTAWEFHQKQRGDFDDKKGKFSQEKKLETYLIAPYDLKKSFKLVLEKAGIKNFRKHDIRHTAASWMVMMGVPLAIVSKILGHKNIQMTMRYSHLSPDHRKQAVGKIDQILDQLESD